MNLAQALPLRSHHLEPADALGAMGYLPADKATLSLQSLSQNLGELFTDSSG